MGGGGQGGGGNQVKYTHLIDNNQNIRRYFEKIVHTFERSTAFHVNYNLIKLTRNNLNNIK